MVRIQHLWNPMLYCSPESEVLSFVSSSSSCESNKKKKKEKIAKKTMTPKKNKHFERNRRLILSMWPTGKEYSAAAYFLRLMNLQESLHCSNLRSHTKSLEKYIGQIFLGNLKEVNVKLM